VEERRQVGGSILLALIFLLVTFLLIKQKKSNAPEWHHIENPRLDTGKITYHFST